MAIKTAVLRAMILPETRKLINSVIDKLGEEGPQVVINIDSLQGYFNNVRETAEKEAFSISSRSVPDAGMRL